MTNDNKNSGAVPSLALGTEYLRAHMAEAAADPTRPKYHFASPAGNLLDTWGAFYRRGEYHLFYDINADGSTERYAGYFGHISSRDLVSWRSLPLALAPETDKGELQLNDGCITVNGDGKPLMWYTRVFDDGRAREHVAVFGDDDMVTWRRAEDVPPITMDNHGGPIFENEWSDPILFSEGGRTFMLISKCVTKDGRRGVIPIYEAVDDRLLSWKYRGIFLDETGEVLNFVKLGDTWVLIHSPYSNPVWIAGSFDPDACRFHPERRGVLSYGYIEQGRCVSRGVWNNVSRGFYATTTVTDPHGDSLIFGWVSGFDAPEPKGWMGAVGIPRKLTLDKEKRLLMQPVKQLEALRLDETQVRANGGEYVTSNAFELTLRLCDFASDELTVEIGDAVITFGSEGLRLRDISVEPSETGVPEQLTLYVDVCMAELFVNGGRCSITRCIPALPEEVCVRIRPKSGGMKITEGWIRNLKSMKEMPTEA